MLHFTKMMFYKIKAYNYDFSKVVCLIFLYNVLKDFETQSGKIG